MLLSKRFFANFGGGIKGIVGGLLGHVLSRPRFPGANKVKGIRGPRDSIVK